MERIKILFVTDHIGGGGAERQFLNLINNIDREQFEPHMFITERKGDRFSELSKDIKVYGLIDSEKRQTMRSLGLMRKIIVEIRPHIVQTWLDYSTFLTSLVLKTFHSKPLFIASHRTSTEELYNYEVRFGRLKKDLLVWAYKQASTVTTNSKFLMEQLRNYGIEKIEVIYNGIHIDRFKKLFSKEELKKRLGLNPTIFYMIFAGSLVERKGIMYLLEAVKGIKRDHICLLIMGDGDLKEKIEVMIEKDQKILSLGYKRNAIEYIKAGDLLVLPSIYEGLPNVILEAMAVGTPVVATNVYGIPELIEDNVNGLLVPPGNVEELVRSIEQIIDNPDTAGKFAECSLEKVHYFTVERMTKEYEKLYATMYSGAKE